MRNRRSVAPIFILVAILVGLWLVYKQSQNPRHSPGIAETPQARSGPADIYPDPARTPGTTNPEITQDNLRETICNPRWSTRSIRPSSEYTNRLKMEQIREYGYSDFSRKDYEEDHFIPLELGGNPTDPRNLWPEPFDTSIPDGGAHYKDKVENYLRAEVCAGTLTLQEAQQEITQDWYRVYTTSVPHQ